MSRQNTNIASQEIARTAGARTYKHLMKKGFFTKHEQYEKLAKVILKLSNEYNQMMAQKGLVLDYNTVMSKNQIDTRGVRMKDNDPQTIPDFAPTDRAMYQAYEASLSPTDLYYSVVPCFTEGVMQFNKERFIMWEILDLKPEERIIEIQLTDYSGTKETWSAGISAKARMSFPEHKEGETGNNIHVEIEESELSAYSSIYQMIKPTELGWTKYETKLWRESVVHNARITEQLMEEQNTSNAIEMTRLFSASVHVVNYYLALNKPVRPKPAATAAATAAPNAEKPTKIVKISDYPQPQKIIRYVGKIAVKSAKPPRMPTEKTVIQYRLASWQTRGHLRHYKSGKVVYVQPSVHTRRCLKDKKNGDQPPQTVIRLRHDDPDSPILPKDPSNNA